MRGKKGQVISLPPWGYLVLLIGAIIGIIVIFSYYKHQIVQFIGGFLAIAGGYAIMKGKSNKYTVTITFLGIIMLFLGQTLQAMFI